MKTSLILKSAAALAILFVALWIFASLRYSFRCSEPRTSCLAHRQAGCSLDAEYKVLLSGRPIDATCDMTTDGGGWTLVGNYLHRAVPQAQDKTKVLALFDRLPIQNRSELGTDEFGTPAWGHAS